MKRIPQLKFIQIPSALLRGEGRKNLYTIFGNLWKGRGLQVFAVSLLILLTAHVAQAQSVDVSTFKISETSLNQKSLFQTTLHNKNNHVVAVRLNATLTHASGRAVLRIRTADFNLPPGESALQSVASALVQTEFLDPDFEKIHARTNSLPPGLYEWCVSLEILKDPEEFAERCFDLQRLEDFSIWLELPENQEVIETTHPQFMWNCGSSNIGLLQDLSYTMRIVEVSESQNPQEAIRRNPVIHESRGLRSQTLFYPADGRYLVAGKQYAWQVDAIFGKLLLGTSEAWVFRLAADSLPNDIPRDQAYIDLDADFGNALFYAVGKLKLSKYERDSAHNLEIAVTDDKGNVLDMGNKKIPLKLGPNRVDLDLTEVRDFKHLKFYTVVIQQGNTPLRLRIRYIDPERLK